MAWPSRLKRFIAAPLMWPFAVIVRDEVRHGLSEVALPEWRDPIETLVLDRSYEPLGVRIRIRGPIRRLNDVEPRLGEEFAYGATPLRVSIADEHPVSDQGPVVGKD